MGIVDTVKDVATLVQKADNIQLYQKILELQTQIMALLDENSTLRRETTEARDRMRFQGALQFRDNMYWCASDTGEEDGPFCSKCWDADGKAIRLHTLESGALFCPNCQRSTPGNRPRPAPRPPRSGPGWVRDY